MSKNSKKALFQWYKKIVFAALFCQLTFISYSQDSTHFVFQKKKLSIVLGTEVVGYAGTMIGLNQLWYKNYPRSSFHFFNDNQEWLQMDKMGHITTSYYVGWAGIKVLKWTGAKRKKSHLLGRFFGIDFFNKYRSSGRIFYRMGIFCRRWNG